MRTRQLAMAAAVAAAGFAALPAAAQDTPFTGGRVEVLGGYDNLQDGSDGDSEGRDGFGYGVAAGYDIQAGGVVLGIEGEVSDSTTKVRTTDAISTGDRLQVETGRDLYVGGRVGYAISPTALVYGKAGYTNARLKTSYDDGTDAFSADSDLDGYRLGAGIELNITPSAYVKGEYRYSHYGEIDDVEVDLDRHQLMAGVGIRF